MTSHDTTDIRAERQLDAVIRWTLRESVDGAAPRPEAWRGICERISSESVRARGARWRELRLACRAIALWILRSLTGPRKGFPYPGSAECVRMQGRYGLCLLLYQEDLTMLLGHAL